MDCFRGRLGPRGLCKGGRVEDRPGGEVEFRMEGKMSLCLEPSFPENGMLVMSAWDRCIGGSSIDERGIRPVSLSECQSCGAGNAKKG